MNRSIVGACFGVLLSVGAAFAGPIEDGLAAYERREFTKALDMLRPLAEQGDARAQFTLAKMFDEGDGVAQDEAQADKWFGKAAEQGHAEAQLTLGLAAQIAEKYAEALRWYRLSAAQENAEAQYHLGGLYYIGRGVKKDLAEALKWTRRSAEKGFPAAQYRVGAIYANGNGVTEDLVEGVKWMRLSVAQGFANAQNHLAVIYYLGKGGIAEDYAEAAKLYRLAAVQGHADSQMQLGWMYEQGKGVQKSLIRAHMWYHARATSEAGDPKDAVEARNKVEKSMSAWQIAEARKLASDCKLRELKGCG